MQQQTKVPEKKGRDPKDFPTQLVCPCGSEEVTVSGKEPPRTGRTLFRGRPETMVECDQCGHSGPPKKFFRVRRRRTGSPKPEASCIIAMKKYQGEVRGVKGGKRFFFVGMNGNERLEAWLSRSEIVLL